MEQSGKRDFLRTAALLLAVFVGLSHMQKPLKIPKTRFSCQGRITGYYADIDTGCQIYHMCDGLGRKFSYACPNTTLFQQRMLVCDHWYMVNCSASERDYSANSLIGQRDKPFVADDEDHKRTPRPDILSVPYANEFNYYGQLESETPTGSENNIEKVDELITNDNNELNEETVQFSVPTRWSTELSNINQYTTPSPGGFTGRPIIVGGGDEIEINSESSPTVGPQQSQNLGRNKEVSGTILNRGNFGIINPPSILFQPPKYDIKTSSVEDNVDDFQNNLLHRSSSTTVRSIASFNNQFFSNSPRGESQDIGLRDNSEKSDTPLFNFIKRFNPDEKPPLQSSDSGNQFTESRTTAPQSQRSINLPLEIQSSSETAGFVPIVNNNRIPNTVAKISLTDINPPKQSISSSQEKTLSTPTSFNVDENSVTRLEAEREEINRIENDNSIQQPAVDLLPPKFEFTEVSSATLGPPIYYEWKWAAPAFDLEPPIFSSDGRETNSNNEVQRDGRPAFALPRSTTQTPEPDLIQKSIVNQNLSENSENFKMEPYFIPDYEFPLDKQHPGYGEDGALTSFQVRIPNLSESQSESHPYYGENSQCPQCHPSFVMPGTCKPCVMIRR